MLRACGLSAADVEPVSDIAMFARLAKMRKVNEARRAATTQAPRPRARGIRISEPVPLTRPTVTTISSPPAPRRPVPSEQLRVQKRARVDLVDLANVASSSSGPRFTTPARGSYDTSEEAGMKDILYQLEAMSLSVFMEISIPERPPVNTELTPLNYQPHLYEKSSILVDPTGDIAMELYSHSMLPRDKTMLLKQAHPWVEKEAASLTSQVNLCIHQLSLTCSHYKNESENLERKLKDYQDAVTANW